MCLPVMCKTAQFIEQITVSVFSATLDFAKGMPPAETGGRALINKGEDQEPSPGSS